MLPAFLTTGTHYKITYKDNSLLTCVFHGETDPQGWICVTPVEEGDHALIWVRLDEVRAMTVLPGQRAYQPRRARKTAAKKVRAVRRAAKKAVGRPPKARPVGRPPKAKAK